jgi:hypothetical protein
MKIDISDAGTAYVHVRGADWMEARALLVKDARRAALLRSRSFSGRADWMEARA